MKKHPKQQKPIAWTTVHRREAIRAFLRFIDRIVGETLDGVINVYGPIEISPHETVSEFAFRHGLRRLNAWRDEHERVDIDAEVRRVDALATGRLVREPTFRQATVQYIRTSPSDIAFASTWKLEPGAPHPRGAVVTRISRIRSPRPLTESRLSVDPPPAPRKHRAKRENRKQSH